MVENKLGRNAQYFFQGLATDITHRSSKNAPLKYYQGLVIAYRYSLHTPREIKNNPQAH